MDGAKDRHVGLQIRLQHPAVIIRVLPVVVRMHSSTYMIWTVLTMFYCSWPLWIWKPDSVLKLCTRLPSMVKVILNRTYRIYTRLHRSRSWPLNDIGQRFIRWRLRDLRSSGDRWLFFFRWNGPQGMSNGARLNVISESLYRIIYQGWQLRQQNQPRNDNPPSPGVDE